LADIDLEMASDPRDYKLQISSMPPVSSEPPAQARPWLSVLFNCCGVYQRVYRHATRDEYVGRCPKCTRAVKFVVGDEGTTSRSFVVD
jgi:hypothetical protein